MAKTENPMKGLYRKLASFGLPKAWVQQNLLPSWWDDEAALSNAGFAEALLHVSRTAGLDLASLRENVEAAKPVAGRHRRGTFRPSAIAGTGTGTASVNSPELRPTGSSRWSARSSPGPRTGRVWAETGGLSTRHC